MDRWVDIAFDCLPLRSVGRLDIPIDASPKHRQMCERIKAALDKHGAHNTYFVYNAHCRYHLVNHPQQGMLEFRFTGTVLTDVGDMQAQSCDLDLELVRETCDWLTEPIVQWFHETVRHSLLVEFNRYIEAGDLEQARKRLEKLRETADESGGYLGLYL